MVGSRKGVRDIALATTVRKVGRRQLTIRENVHGPSQPGPDRRNYLAKPFIGLRHPFVSRQQPSVGFVRLFRRRCDRTVDADGVLAAVRTIRRNPFPRCGPARRTRPFRKPLVGCGG